MNNVTKLPDSYAKAESSNNYKLLIINEQAIEEAKTEAEAVLNAVDLQQATGKTLDLYGNMVGQNRGKLNDMQYRALILTRIGIYLAQGDYTTVIECVKNIFNCKGDDIILRDGTESCEVIIEKFPLGLLANTDLTSNQAIEAIENLLPICTKIKRDVDFVGTFEFGDTEEIYDPTSGFGNISQTQGGYLGMLLGEDESGGLLPL